MFAWASGLAALVLIVAAVFAPRPLDWSYSFSRNKEIPFGNYLLFESLPNLFPGQEIETAWTRPDVFLEDEKPQNTNFIYINGRIEIEDDASQKLLDVASDGNHVFIATEHLYGKLADTLNVDYKPDVMGGSNFFGADSLGFRFTNPELRSSAGYWYPRWMTRFYFAKYDSTRTKVLGYDHKGDVNFIRVKQGDGFFYLHSNPLAFTNYHLLSRNNGEYISRAFSYLPVQRTVWDEFYKPGSRNQEGLFDYVLDHTSLRIAWYIVVFGIIVLMVFGTRRKQRPIPVVRKPVNTSLSFVGTVARLYYSRHDHLNIARKRYTYLLEFLRSRYYMNTFSDESKMISEVSRKSGVPERSVAVLFKMGNKLERVSQITREDLEQFNRQIEFFYNNCR
ncbi:MAG: DUF4350 domain-containing protein [Marinilabiliaceae bacterium]